MHLRPLDLCLPQIPRKMLSHTAMGLYDDKDRLVTDLECYLYEKINGSILQEYIRESMNGNRNKWK